MREYDIAPFHYEIGLEVLRRGRSGRQRQYSEITDKSLKLEAGSQEL